MPTTGSANDYFAQMQDVVAHDYFWDVQMQQLRNPLCAFSPSRRLVSSQNALERDDFLDKAGFCDLPEDRMFFFNTVSYDTGQRVTLSNGALPSPENAAVPSVLTPD